MTPDSSFFDALMDAAVDAIIIIDQQAIIQRFNRSAQTLFGYSEDEVTGKNIKMLMPEPVRSRHDEYISNYNRTGKAAIIGHGRLEKGKRRNGEVFPMWLSVGESRLHGQVHYVGIIHDLSHQHATEEKVRMLEEQLFHADRLLVLGELTAGIAHEINQPLTAIAAYADAGRHLAEQAAETGKGTGRAADADGLQASGSAADPEDSDSLRIYTRISEQSRRAAAVVERLRNLVRSGTSKKAMHDVQNIIKNTLLLFDFELKNMDVVVQVSIQENLPKIRVDEIQIQQILVNLVKNALDAVSDAGGPQGRVDIAVHSDAEYLNIAVSDNGAGVPQDSLKHLFEPFYTSKPKGVGLGLSICKNIAAAHGASLQHSPVQPHGACFTLSIPLANIG